MPLDPNKKTTRRRFLQGKDAVESLRDTLNPPAESLMPSQLIGSSESRQQASHVLQFSKKAMGCQFEFIFNGTQYPRVADVVACAFELIEQIEAEISIYRPHSPISQLNRNQPGQPVQFSPRAIKCFQVAQEVSELTKGAFDITSGKLSEIWGFEQRAPAVPEPSQLGSLLNSVDFRSIEVDAVQGYVALRKANAKLNFGGIGKGFAIDECRELLLAAGVTDFLIHGGQSSVAANGNRRTENNDVAGQMKSGWRIGLTDPLIAESRLKEVRLVERCMGTSGSARQALFHQGKRLSHILDPRTGWSGEGAVSATVIADSAAVADALATAFCVMSRTEVERLCHALPEIAAVTFWLDRGQKMPEMVTFNTDALEL
ncbi:MAG TPA: FAD:protein FMN transferase [Pirellulaceae bacterium]|nr:FAD:protein FMN transferase [Pirellulaceae bacterium]HMO90560.1 FAD:protein FMN transferase [Pirellulaceae bacterium]HMP71221.1 FAD:protein FMN transferase [Pirellulaceae bacterium]